MGETCARARNDKPVKHKQSAQKVRDTDPNPALSKYKIDNTYMTKHTRLCNAEE